MDWLKKGWSRSIGLVRYARHIREFLAEPITVEQAAIVIEEGVRQRNARFFDKLERAIYCNPRSPYLKLLKIAGCEFGDVAGLVEREGLEGALHVLAESGVYLTFEEFKCQTPAVRGSQTFEFELEDFDDPNFKAGSAGTTGGTRGKPVPIRWSFGQTAQAAPHWCVFFAENDCLGLPLIYWSPGHSGASAPQVACAKFNQRFDHWFISQEMVNLKDRAYVFCLQWIGRWLAGFPEPQNVPYHDSETVLECVLNRLSQAKAVCINTTPSAAVRLSLSAQERHASLSGVTFLLGSEPLTPARRLSIEESGAKARPLYGSQEATWTGGQCKHPQHADEVHVLRDLHVLISGTLPDATPEDEVPPLLFTSLAPLTPKILLNTDIGDRGIIGYRRCDCLYDRLGCRQTIHTIRSSDKLTEFGVTIWVSDVYQVLESALPRRLGGAPGDFQLLETSTPEGLPHYLLLVHPRLASIDEQTLPKLFLAELGKLKSHYGFMTSIWEREQILEVRRCPPIPTQRGKVLAFHRVRGNKPGGYNLPLTEHRDR